MDMTGSFAVIVRIYTRISAIGQVEAILATMPDTSERPPSG